MPYNHPKKDVQIAFEINMRDLKPLPSLALGAKRIHFAYTEEWVRRGEVDDTVVRCESLGKQGQTESYAPGRKGATLQHTSESFLGTWDCINGKVDGGHI